MLIGKVLLNKVRSLSNQSEDQIARACGYTSPTRSILRKSFYRALVAARGYRLPTFARNTVNKGRQAEFRTRVHGNGNLLIGNAYTRRLGLEPGMEFRIEIHQESRSVSLLPLPMVNQSPSLNFNDISQKIKD
uniref:Transcriptional regulator n=1 Tax=Paulinella longichromatophora TaxID=1708747 RepID=A0A2H4ZQG3_9EUKA|nr:transcriptional regulator [Paulinella longichromatophora]